MQKEKKAAKKAAMKLRQQRLSITVKSRTAAEDPEALLFKSNHRMHVTGKALDLYL